MSASGGAALARESHDLSASAMAALGHMFAWQHQDDAVGPT
jgi:hypothetical protein